MITVEDLVLQDLSIWNFMLEKELQKSNPNKIDIEILSVRVDTLQKIVDQVNKRKID
jgi:hypothetical protein